MTSDGARIGRGALAYLVGALALMLGGCGGGEDLPAPGADGLVVVHWWDEQRRGPPAYLQAERVEQGDAEFARLTFRTVMMRLPGTDAVAYVNAPHAVYERGAQDEIVLGAAPQQPVDGPVRFLGTWGGTVFMGRAARAVFDEATHRMRLDEVELVGDGVRQRTAYAAISTSQPVLFGELVRLRDAPALTTALAALPAPLVLPPLRQ